MRNPETLNPKEAELLSLSFGRPLSGDMLHTYSFAELSKILLYIDNRHLDIATWQYAIQRSAWVCAASAWVSPGPAA